MEQPDIMVLIEKIKEKKKKPKAVKIVKEKVEKKKPEAVKRPRAVMLKITQAEVDWFFNRQECCFKDRDKAKQICEMRMQGLTYREIGEKVNLSWDRARMYVQKVHQSYETYQRAM